MGTLRLLLAVSVVLEHLGSSIQWIGGWRAVQVFYYISGFYMALILAGKYHDKGYFTFLGNRILRLFPIYYLTLLLIGLRWLISYYHHVPCEYYFPHCGKVIWKNWGSLGFIVFTQLGILGQDWLFFLKLDPDGFFHFAKDGLVEPLQAYAYNINPVSWTLGLELTFYVIAPILLKKTNKTLLGIVILSLLLRAVGFFYLDLNGLVWNYRFFPFEVAIFVLGSLCYRGYLSQLRHYFEKMNKLPWLLSVAVIFSTLFFSFLEKGLTHPTLFYYLITAASIPALFHLTQKSNLDRQIGDLSFPIYLIHMPVISLAKRLLTSNSFILLTIVISVALILNICISQPIDKIRNNRLN